MAGLGTDVGNMKHKGHQTPWRSVDGRYVCSEINQDSLCLSRHIRCGRSSEIDSIEDQRLHRPTGARASSVDDDKTPNSSA